MRRKKISGTVRVLDKIDLTIILTDLRPTDISRIFGITVPSVYDRIYRIADAYNVEPNLTVIRTVVPDKYMFKVDLLATLLFGEAGFTLKDILKVMSDESQTNKNAVKINKNKTDKIKN